MSRPDRSGKKVVIAAHAISIEELIAVADGARLELGPDARVRIEAGRTVVDRAVAGPDLIYGLNSGLGHLRDERVPVDVLATYQAVIVRAHDGGVGPPLPSRVVRAAMAARVAGISRGGSGASPAVADTLVAMLNAGIHPVVPSVGSVGAADLMHMAAIGRVAMGEGTADVKGTIVAGGAALAAAGIAPLQPGPKDGLALISANAVSVGHGALVVERAGRLADAADVAVALSLDVMRGNPSTVDPAVAAVKGVAGQTASADRIRALLAGSLVTQPGGPASVQDPLSFRVAPQVHGAFRELIGFARSAVTAELGASDDNPLVSVEEDRLISNGNFHPIAMALAFDALRPAIAHVGQLMDRRQSHLWGLVFSDDVYQSSEEMEAAIQEGGPLLRYASATIYADLRGLAGPATLDVPSLDKEVEDHATNAPATVAQSDRALDRLEEILAIELLTSHKLAQARAAAGPLGKGSIAAARALDGLLAGMPAGASSAEIHAATVKALEDGLVGGIAASS